MKHHETLDDARAAVGEESGDAASLDDGRNGLGRHARPVAERRQQIPAHDGHVAPGIRGDARAADILALMREVRLTVQARHGRILHPEIVALGREWKDLL